MPRDREGSFEPKIVRKRQRRMSGIDELVISLAAKGLTRECPICRVGMTKSKERQVYGDQH